jgi:hypothetical protein
MKSEEMSAGNALPEGAPMQERSKENMVGVTPGIKDAAEKKMESAASDLKPPMEESLEAMQKVETADKTVSVPETLDNGFIPVQPLEVPLSGEQKVEIATQPNPKPATGVDPFFKPEPEILSPALSESPSLQNDSPKVVAQVSDKKVKIVTNKDPLRIRAGPTSDSRVLATVAKGSLVPFVKEENGWYKIEFSTGQMGWVSKKYALMVE